MEPVRDRPTAVLPDSKKKRGESKVIIEYPFFEQTLNQLKNVDALNHLVVRWPSKKLVCINVPSSWFYSTCFKNQSGTHHFVYFYDGDLVKEEKVILAVRTHPKSSTGEIIHLKKSEAMSGTDVLKLGINLLNKLKIKKKYLNDASSFEFAKGISFFMRVYVPIISPDGKSWYGKHKFKPMLCRNMEGARNMDGATEEERQVPIYNQDPNFYYESINYIRTMPIADLVKEVITDANEKIELMDMAVLHRAATVHDLAKAAFEESDKTHFIRFNQIALKPVVPENGSLIKQKYNIALDCLYSTKIFVLDEDEPLIAVPDFEEMTDTLSGKAVSYDTFIKNVRL